MQLDRILLVQLIGSEQPDTEIEKFYEDLTKLLDTIKPNEITIVLRDFNAKFGKGREEDAVGEHGLGITNRRE